VFVYSFILYLKYRKMYFVVMSAIFAGLAAYVRPIGYYVGMVTFLFMLYESVGGDFKKKLKYALVFIVITYSVIGLWQVRNYVRVGDPTFCSVGRYDLERQGIFHSYSRNADPYTKGMAPLPYYINVSFRSLMSVMTKPGTLKYFGSTTLTYVGKVVSYPWMALWLSGFIIGVLAMRKNIYIQFLFFVASYFIFASVGAQMWIMGEKLRVSIMPFIAVISAYGYLCLIRKIGKRKIRYKYETGESPAWR
jgi:hypothetical protein